MGLQLKYTFSSRGDGLMDIVVVCFLVRKYCLEVATFILSHELDWKHTESYKVCVYSVSYGSVSNTPGKAALGMNWLVHKGVF